MVYNIVISLVCIIQDDMFNMDDISDMWGGGASPLSERRSSDVRSTDSRPRVRKKQTERSPPVMAAEDKLLLPGKFYCILNLELLNEISHTTGLRLQDLNHCCMETIKVVDSAWYLRPIHI